MSVPTPPGAGRLHPRRCPASLRPLLDAVPDADAATFARHSVPVPEGARESAVLMLFADHPVHGPDVLLVERAATLRSHAGQVAFPGGTVDPGDADVVATALREAEEETGLEPGGVTPLALLPRLFLPPTGFAVTPVLAAWDRPSAVHAVDAGETAAVVRVPLDHLADPANRIKVSAPSGFVGPAFLVEGLLVWGFTGALLSAVLDLGGWARPWESGARVHDVSRAWAAARAGRQEVAGQ